MWMVVPKFPRGSPKHAEMSRLSWKRIGKYILLLWVLGLLFGVRIFFLSVQCIETLRHHWQKQDQEIRFSVPCGVVFSRVAPFFIEQGTWAMIDHGGFSQLWFKCGWPKKDATTSNKNMARYRRGFTRDMLSCHILLSLILLGAPPPSSRVKTRDETGWAGFIFPHFWLGWSLGVSTTFSNRFCHGPPPGPAAPAAAPAAARPAALRVVP